MTESTGKFVKVDQLRQAVRQKCRMHYVLFQETVDEARRNARGINLRELALMSDSVMIFVGWLTDLMSLFRVV